MKKGILPFPCHVLVCTRDRGEANQSCADKNAENIRLQIKMRVKERGWKGKVRVTSTGCLGLTQSGPNVIIYPSGQWFSEVTSEDVEAILFEIELALLSAGSEMRQKLEAAKGPGSGIFSNTEDSDFFLKPF